MFVKICGVRRERDADACLALAVDALGVNLVASSPRFADEASAARIAEHVGGRATIVWVCGTAPPAYLAELLERFPRSLVQRCDPAWPWPASLAADRRVEVVRLVEDADVARAVKATSPFMISDAPSGLGGTGKRAVWALTAKLALQARVLLAGGLTPLNVGEGVRMVQPYGVDVASGVEAAPGEKDPVLLRRFVEAARGK